LDVDEILIRIWENLLARVSGPMKFRLLLQLHRGLDEAQTGGWNRPESHWV
jgi:hypothetical protein